MGRAAASLTVALLVLFCGASVAVATPADGKAQNQLTLVIGGDLGLGGSGEPVDERGARRHGSLYPWHQLTEGLAGLVNGDVNFANLETIVTRNNTLRAAQKAFTFRSHPEGVRHLIQTGFNVLSTANNHVGDYGVRGMQETVSELAKLRAQGLLAFPGIGSTRREAGGPSLVVARERRLLFSAIGIGGREPSQGSPGILSYHPSRDFEDAVEWLAAEDAQYRVLSVHYGTELSVRPSRDAIEKFRDYGARGKGIDLIIGHHAHVVAGVQVIDGRLIFYGLGNLLHPGMQDMSRFDACRDYGLLAKLHLAENEKGRLSAKAVEVWPLDEMHLKAQPMTGAQGSARIAVLNKLALELDDHATGAKGLRFRAREDGSGLACLDGAAESGGQIAELCRDWAPETIATQPTRASSCANSLTVTAARRGPRAKVARTRAEPSLLEQMFGAQ